MRRYLTEYENVCDGGQLYAGPILEADSQSAAEAMTACVYGPNGEQLTVIGELVEQYLIDEDTTHSRVRQFTRIMPMRES